MVPFIKSVLDKPESCKKITTVLDSELVGKVVQLLKQVFIAFLI